MVFTRRSGSLSSTRWTSGRFSPIWRYCTIFYYPVIHCRPQLDIMYRYSECGYCTVLYVYNTPGSGTSVFTSDCLFIFISISGSCVQMNPTIWITMIETVIWNIGYECLRHSVADPGCLFRIPDPYFSMPDPGSRVKNIPDHGSGSASKNIRILNLKMFLNSRKNDLGCSSRIGFFAFADPRFRGQKGTGSRIRIRNTASTLLLMGSY